MAELELTPPPGTPDSPRHITIFQVTDSEWWAGETLEQCVAAAKETWGDLGPDDVDMFEDAVELNEAAMERLMFCYDEDDRSKKHSFRTELDMRLADQSQKFPQFFASTEG